MYTLKNSLKNKLLLLLLLFDLCWLIVVVCIGANSVIGD
jgi:hypothetical protein